MKRFRSLMIVCLIAQLLIAPIIVRGQSPLPPATGSTASTLTPQKLKLSPGAQEAAQIIGVQELLDRLAALPPRTPGSPMSAEELSIRQQISESVLAASLEIDGLQAEIDTEISETNEIRNVLEARRDRVVGLNSIAQFVSGGVLGVVSSSLQYKDSTANWGNTAGIVAGGISMVLSVIGLRQQKGGTGKLGVAPNMLAKFFDRKPEFHSDYPDEIWRYLNNVPPTENGEGTRREQLIKQWLKVGRIDDVGSKKGQEKIDLLTSSISKPKGLSIDTLQDRAAMLSDVRARISLLKRDLSKLMLAVRMRG